MLANLLKCDIILVVTDITLVSISAGIAQSVEHFTRNEGVVGSSPISSLVIREKGSACLSDIPFFVSGRNACDTFTDCPIDRTSVFPVLRSFS